MILCSLVNIGGKYSENLAKYLTWRNVNKVLKIFSLVGSWFCRQTCLWLAFTGKILFWEHLVAPSFFLLAENRRWSRDRPCYQLQFIPTFTNAAIQLPSGAVISFSCDATQKQKQKTWGNPQEGVGWKKTSNSWVVPSSVLAGVTVVYLGLASITRYQLMGKEAVNKI